jgi:hypothetical protein
MDTEDMSRSIIPEACEPFVVHDRQRSLLRKILKMVPKSLYALQFSTPLEVKKPDVKIISNILIRTANGIIPQYEASVRFNVEKWIGDYNIFTKNDALFVRFFIYPNFPIDISFRFIGSDGCEQAATFSGVSSFITPSELKFYQKITNTIGYPIQNMYFDVDINSISRFAHILE